ncbi:DNA topoisomerase I [Ammonifex degensii KC4]|uniref:DNA topoisomerase 1 n=1 Tax=Ammonifex degensii (strain DSM 10501 / KC4) TaxID=429009 RepID=C9RBU3_AMMDK|nr:type I DNA topoisomerase [Ammonifex degensii]ACX51720.1 DNA topoisomerase I [Ammonifex degensii KC4]
MKHLIIVESPAKARTLSKFLGSQFLVKASMGHVRDLPKSELGVDLENGFTPKYVTIRGKGKVIQELKSYVAKADTVLMASDPDREGEAIAWHLCHLLGIPPETPCRVEFHEITKNAVLNSLKSPRPIDLNRVNAQQARRVLDRLVGYGLSPLLWRKVKRGLSAGRVQSVALRLVVEREEEIEAFKPEEYWDLAVWLLTPEEERVLARLARFKGKKFTCRTAEEVERVKSATASAAFRVARVVRQERSKAPPLPFTTSQMVQEANRRLGMRLERTMAVAQQLYEGVDLGPEGPVGLITYIRTDSTRVSEEAKERAWAFIKEHYGAEFVGDVPPKERKAKGRVEDAHEAIRPTDVYRTPEKVKPYLTPDQYKLYRLIWERFLAAHMAPAKYFLTRAEIEVGDYTFYATGRQLLFPGFLRLWRPEEEEEEGKLPPLREGEVLTFQEFVPQQHFTTPPPRYTEGTLVKALEEKGVGRPSTYAPTIETILKRGYVVRVDKYLHPTPLGRTVVELLKEHFPGIVDVGFTAAMEEKLDLVEEGQADWVDILREFYQSFSQDLVRADAAIEKVSLPDTFTDISCPRCGCPMVKKTGRYGEFLACSGYPECQMRMPVGTGVKCPRCGGELVKRRSKKGRYFYGCNRYPECNFVVWSEPVPEPCPECGSLMVRRGRGKKKRVICTNESCGYQRLEE